MSYQVMDRATIDTNVRKHAVRGRGIDRQRARKWGEAQIEHSEWWLKIGEGGEKTSKEGKKETEVLEKERKWVKTEK